MLVAITIVLCTLAPGQDKFPMTCHPFQTIEVQHRLTVRAGLPHRQRWLGAAEPDQEQLLRGYDLSDDYAARLAEQTGQGRSAFRDTAMDQEICRLAGRLVSLGEGTAVQLSATCGGHYADLTSVRA